MRSEQTKSYWSCKQYMGKLYPFREEMVCGLCLFLKVPTHCCYLALEPSLKRGVVGKEWVGFSSRRQTNLVSQFSVNELILYLTLCLTQPCTSCILKINLTLHTKGSGLCHELTVRFRVETGHSRKASCMILVGSRPHLRVGCAHTRLN